MAASTGLSMRPATFGARPPSNPHGRERMRHPWRSWRRTSETTERLIWARAGTLASLFGLIAVATFAAGCGVDAETRTADATFDRTFGVDGPVELDIHSRS